MDDRYSRRDILATSGATLAALAGCTGESSEDDPTPSNGTAPDTNSSPNREPVYTVEPYERSQSSDGYLILSDGDRLIGGIHTRNTGTNIREEHKEGMYPFDEDAEIYSDGITDDGYAVAFYDKKFVEQEPVHLIVSWKAEENLDVRHNDEIPDSYVTEPGNGLYKATVPLDDFNLKWNDLEEDTGINAAFGHIKDTKIEDGTLNFPKDAKYYDLWLQNYF